MYNEPISGIKSLKVLYCRRRKGYAMFSKTVLIYYSPTRSTAKLCRALGEGLGLPAEEYDLTLPEGRKSEIVLEAGSIAVIGTPVYGGRAHRLLLEGFSRIKTAEGAKVPAVLVSVYGNRHYDMSFANLFEASVNAGLTPVACAAYLAEHSFSRVILPGMPDAEELSVAASHGKGIMEMLSKNCDACMKAEDIPQRPVDIAMIGMHGKRLGGLDPRRPFPDDTCIHCGKCAEVCPLGLIDPEDSSRIEPDCTFCNACVKICPVSAMRFPQPDMKIVADDCMEHFGRDKNVPQLWLAEN